jgi:hypothetical protein
MRGTGEREGEGGDRSEPTEPLVRLDQLAWRRQVGLADKWARHGREREREVEGVFLTRNLKTEIEKKKRTFLEKSFSM